MKSFATWKQTVFKIIFFCLSINAPSYLQCTASCINCKHWLQDLIGAILAIILPVERSVLIVQLCPTLYSPTD